MVNGQTFSGIGYHVNRCFYVNKFDFHNFFISPECVMVFTCT